MKFTVLLLCAIVVLTSCNGHKNDTDLKIKQCILAYLTTGVDKKDMLQIDSVSIISTDTLTEKNCMKIALDRNYNALRGRNGIYESSLRLIKADSALLGTMKQQKALYNKHKDKYDDSSLKEQIVKMVADTLQLNESAAEVQKLKKSIDSLGNLYEKCDSVSFYAYFISAGIYLHDAPSEAGNFIISKDWKVRR